MSGDRTSSSSTVDAMRCVGCERGRVVGEQGWVVVSGPTTSPGAAYCPDCMTNLVRDASGKDACAED